MKAIKSSIPLHISEIDKFDSEIRSWLFNWLGIQRRDWEYIGSFNKKEYMSDVDIAVNEKFLNLEQAEQKLIELGREVKVYKGFNELSFGFEFDKSIIQVDLMFTKNLDWSQFIYYSPNLLMEESKYKGIYRNLLLSSIIITESRVEYDENSCVQYILRLNEGLIGVTKSFLDEVGKRTNISRIIKEEFMTNDPKTFCWMIDLELPCLTFEKVFEQIKNREKYPEIIERFIKFCNKSKIEVPTEIELWEQQRK